MIGNLATVAQEMSGQLMGNGNNAEVAAVSTDTRTLSPGAIYFALKGEQFDGHDFIEQAWDKEAAAVVVSKPELKQKINNSSRSLILVDDTLKALQSLARRHREKFNIPVIGVTGSNGKTTTKDMIAAVLAERFNVLKTHGNYNNEIGLPLTLLQLKNEHEAAVLEMGMRGLKEIAALCQIAGPTAGVITNIGVTHYELLGTVENIAKAKGELLEHIPPEGFCLLNAEDSWSHRLSSLCRGKVLYYGFDGQLQVRASSLQNTDYGINFILGIEGNQVKVELPLPGEHNVLNALAAAGVGYEMGMKLPEIAAGLEKVKLSAMRLATVAGVKGSTIINDAYNANPGSTKASLNILAAQKKSRAIAVLGNMRELGSIEVEGHREVGEYLVELGIDYLLTVGELARYIAEGALDSGMPKDRVFAFSANAEAKQHLLDLIKQGDVVLVKGSRAVKMEEIVEFVTDTGGNN